MAKKLKTKTARMETLCTEIYHYRWAFSTGTQKWQWDSSRLGLNLYAVDLVTGTPSDGVLHCVNLNEAVMFCHGWEAGKNYHTERVEAKSLRVAKANAQTALDQFVSSGQLQTFGHPATPEDVPAEAGASLGGPRTMKGIEEQEKTFQNPEELYATEIETRR